MLDKKVRCESENFKNNLLKGPGELTLKSQKQSLHKDYFSSEGRQSNVSVR